VVSKKQQELWELLFIYTHQKKKKTIMVNISQQLRLEFQPGHPGLESVEMETEGLCRMELCYLEISYRLVSF